MESADKEKLEEVSAEAAKEGQQVSTEESTPKILTSPVSEKENELVSGTPNELAVLSGKFKLDVYPLQPSYC